MAASCSVFGCKSRWTKQQKLLFHKFPLNDPERLQKWLKAIKRESWRPTKHSYLCSLHFTPDSYKSSPKHFLKEDAVPSIDCFSTDDPKIAKKRPIEDSLLMTMKSPVVVLQRNIISEEYATSNHNIKLPSATQNNKMHKSKNILSNNSSFGTSELEIYKDSICLGNSSAFDEEANDISDIEFSDSDDTKKRLDIMTAHYKKSRKKLKMCQQRCNLYRKEIIALKEVINSLREINSVTDDN